jgi:hypothetical protein
MENQEYEKMKEEMREELDDYSPWVKDVKLIIATHKAILGGKSFLFHSGGRLIPEGNKALLEVMLENESNPGERKNLEDMHNYFVENIDSIVELVPPYRDGDGLWGK